MHKPVISFTHCSGFPCGPNFPAKEEPLLAVRSHQTLENIPELGHKLGSKVSQGRGKVLSGSPSTQECSFPTTEGNTHSRKTSEFIPTVENARQGNLSPGFSHGLSRL